MKKGFAAFYDTGRGLYFDGLDTPGQENAWQPANPNRRYFSQHTNSLAVLYGLAGDAMRTPIMEQVMADDSLIAAQPYFLHFVLDALDAAGLFEKYGLAQIRRWTRLVEEFPGRHEGNLGRQLRLLPRLGCDAGLSASFQAPGAYHRGAGF